ncbi:bifunctional phosphopantothenoylcysteine decarboxylase/phosphopantothenate--cysteine ligase CoaBC [[Limnothrix rosea] IAM M-220]|uniref:bifunctional phosphopantothenoylcysteine decarboxylase/phosphopantothenate--cysteine ligase CoaBC n=1 Tax=[Limnothrix rosea] IAM M-220 TaxID=454133 RepID=UPI00095F0471|nr:bifunctional phosphopantothenoylcysteine decarboxylase/phosphopantothenate--cysteine ligase CoaBC [[Limnothrix rosea] IAM M-220]OKH18333.1 phosphopantothenate synthase [[Limnothrix rosea] IAM M-220]
MLRDKKVVVGISGGIAAYKVCEVISRLFQAGAEVRVVLTDSAQRFITPLTVATLSRHAAYTDEDFWDSHQPRPVHIELGEWADLILLAPLTANTLAKVSLGLADTLLANIILASTCPVLGAPAMNTDMWQQLSVQSNWRKLQRDERYHILSPNSGLLACDRRGKGRMSEPIEIVEAVESLIHSRGRRDLSERKILISAGGTREHIDAVRFIGNPSSGKMGLAIAKAAVYRGATVTLVHAPIEVKLLENLPAVERFSVTSSAEMEQSLLKQAAKFDWIIMCAAVGDVRSRIRHDAKLAKADLPESLELETIPDIAAQLGQQKRADQKLIGFAAQTGDITAPALEKLRRKNLDAIAANAIDLPDSGFGSNNNQLVFIDKEGRQATIPMAPKLAIAHHLLDFIKQL